MVQIALVVNPSKRRWRELVALFVEECAARGWPTPDVLETTVAETGRSQAAQTVEGGAARLVVAGGDGTVREVAHGLLGSDVSLGVVPLGTANLFAHNVGISARNLLAAVTIALDGTAQPVDLGLARLDDEPVEHPFLVLTGIGHDAATVAATRDDLKERIGWPAYVTPAARHAISRPVPMTVSIDGEEPRAVPAWSVLAANCGRVRAGVRIAPGARIDDGRLDVMEVTVSRPSQWVPIAAKGVLGHRRDVPGLRTRPARQVEVVAEHPQHVQVDGDIVGRATRLRARVVEHGVRVMMR